MFYPMICVMDLLRVAHEGKEGEVVGRCGGAALPLPGQLGVRMLLQLLAGLAGAANSPLACLCKTMMPLLSPHSRKMSKIFTINLYYNGLTSLCLTYPGSEVGLHRARPHRVPCRLVLLQLLQLSLVVRALGAGYTAGAANTWT